LGLKLLWIWIWRGFFSLGGRALVDSQTLFISEVAFGECGWWWVLFFLGFLELLKRERSQEEAVQSGIQELFWPWCWARNTR